MYLYEKNEKSIVVYSFIPDNNKLIQLKRRYLGDVKSVVLHVNNGDTQDLLFNSPTIMFRALDREEGNGKKTWIEEKSNEETISRYISGEFDLSDPLWVIGDGARRKSFHSGELYNCDSTLLFTGEDYYDGEFLAHGGILLTGYLADFQPLLSGNINNVIFPRLNLDDETIEFLKIFSCTEERTIRLDDLNFMQGNGLITFNDGFQDAIKRSEQILDSYNKVKKLTR